MITRTLAGLAVSVALGGVFAPTAHADNQSFLTDLYAHGWYAHRGDAGLLSNGYQVCSMLNTTTGDHVAEYVYRNTDQSVTVADALEFVVLAVQDLCPWHDHRGQGVAA